MHTDDPFLRDLFEEEAREELDAIESLLPRLAEPEAVAELRRHAHTVKGSSAIMGLREVNAVTAALESLFEVLEAKPSAAGEDVGSSVRATVADVRFLVSGQLAGLDTGHVAADAEQSLRALGIAIAGEPVEATAGEASAVGACPACAQLRPLIAAIAAAQAATLRLLAPSGAVPELVALERAMKAAGVAPHIAAPAGPSEPRHGELLVVDDSRAVRERHRAILTGVGYHVRTAADGAEALGLLAERSADAVITDLDMPGIDGLRLTTEIRQRPELSSPAILVVTSRGDAKTRDRLLGAGADAFLPKDDADADRLLAQVARLLADAS